MGGWLESGRGRAVSGWISVGGSIGYELVLLVRPGLQARRLVERVARCRATRAAAVAALAAGDRRHLRRMARVARFEARVPGRVRPGHGALPDRVPARRLPGRGAGRPRVAGGMG